MVYNQYKYPKKGVKLQMENENMRENEEMNFDAENENTAAAENTAVNENDVDAVSADSVENAANEEILSDDYDDGATEAYAETESEEADREAAEDGLEGESGGFAEETEYITEDAGFAKKKSNKTLMRVIAGIAAVCIIAAAYCGITINGVGSKTVVAHPLPASAESGNTTEKIATIKYENPLVSMCETLALGKNNTAAFTVNGQKISKQIFEFALNSAAVNYAYNLKSNGKVKELKDFNWSVKDEETGLTRAEYAKGYAVNMLVPIYAIIGEGEKRGITLTKEEEDDMNKWLKQVKEQYGDKFEDAIHESGYTDEKALIDVQKMQTLMQKVYSDIEENMSKYADEKTLKKYMDNDKITAKHILIKFADESDEAKANAKKKADEVLAKVKAGEDFDKLMKDNNEDTGEPDSGYTFANDGTMVKEFSDAAFKLNVGEVSGLVETEFGYHIIKRVERTPDIQEYINMLTENAKVRLNKGIYDKITVNTDVAKLIGEK